MPKFASRAHQGILVGYRLQVGGVWGKDYQVFPLNYFRDYDYNTPCNMRDLIPITTQECKLTGTLSFPLKSRYDAHKRMLPNCIIQPASFFEQSLDEEEEDQDEGDLEPAAGGAGVGDAAVTDEPLPLAEKVFCRRLPKHP